MSRRRRIGVGLLLSVAIVTLALATVLESSAVTVALGVTCPLALAWAYILVQDIKDLRRR